MKEIKLEELNAPNVDIILDIYQNEYILLEKKKSDNLIGLFLDGLVTCSSILISFNKDDYLFFAHIDEKSDIIKVIKENIIYKIININITNIDIHYSKGISSIKNKEIDYDNIIRDIMLIFNKSFFEKNGKMINATKKEHNSPISFLKIFEESIFKKIKNYQINKLEKYTKDNQKKKEIYEKAIEFYKNDINENLNIIYYFDHDRLNKVLKILKIKLFERKI